MASPSTSPDLPLNPALAVSGLLTRLGLFLLVVLTPILAMGSRRVVSVLVPVATVLLIIAAALDGRLPAAALRLARLLARPTTLAVLALLIWAGVTILWTPRPGPVPGHLANLAATLLLFAGAIACLGERVRSSDVNLIPIGVALAAVTLAFEFAPRSPLRALLEADPAGLESQRAAMLLVLLLWPAGSALLVRGRVLGVVLLVLVALGALWLVHDLVVLSAMLAGLAAFLLALAGPDLAVPAVGVVLLGLLTLAPVIGWVLAHHGGFLLPAAGDSLVAVWSDVTYALPIHLLQGFGYDASGALERNNTGVLLDSPRNAALQVWLELGLVGVVLAAAALALVLLAMRRLPPRVLPAGLAMMLSAGLMMFSGLAAWQVWWITALGLSAVSLAFVARRAARLVDAEADAPVLQALDDWARSDSIIPFPVPDPSAAAPRPASRRPWRSRSGSRR